MSTRYASGAFDAKGAFETYDLRVRQSDDSCTARIAIPGGQSSDTTITLPSATGTLAVAADFDDYSTGSEVTAEIAAAVAAYVPTASTTLYNAPRVGATAGFVTSGANDYAAATLPASQTGSTVVFPVSPLRVGASIVSFALAGALVVSSGSDPVTVDATLWRMPTTLVPVNLGAVTQVALTESAVFAPSKTLTSPHTVLADNSYYILVTATTGANEDILLTNVSVTTA